MDSITNHNMELRTNKHLSSEERFYIQTRQQAGATISSIATDLGRSRTTIYNELKRGTVDQIKHGKATKIYFSDAGQAAYEKSRKGSFSRLKIDAVHSFLEWAKEKIMGPSHWSIDACVGVAKQQKLFSPESMVCTKTLYNYVHEKLFLTVWDFPCIVNRKHSGYKHRSRRRNLGLSIDERDLSIDTREEFGHWEIDTVRGIKSKDEPVLITLAERKTRYNVQLRAASASAHDVATCVQEWLARQARGVVKSITSDNGSEFALLTEHCKAICPVYFAHPNAPWQRGTNERHNGLLRRFIPKGKAISQVSLATLALVNQWINHLPRKLLGYRTPHEVFIAEVRKVLF